MESARPKAALWRGRVGAGRVGLRLFCVLRRKQVMAEIAEKGLRGQEMFAPEIDRQGGKGNCRF